MTGAPLIGVERVIVHHGLNSGMQLVRNWFAGLGRHLDKCDDGGDFFTMGVFVAAALTTAGRALGSFK
ncbi:hypothetical protein MXEN_04203 [Mycobacterium xenopi RIVM700367]|uniref:hypothetical protein n=1 Tax=Mycobacterium xenopi TaxID=1789 RepID=UPI00025AD758|nr:hypothetical protein [Mycobacterium xenopi]EID16291.1 hypothetical protein MXEN_04203 [Mycobacterium xenopi RIVM700367]